jgi:hypothetical protein
MRVTHIGFLATQKGSADLHGTGAEHKRCRCSAAVGHPAGGDDRNPHRVDDLRQEREQSGLHAHVDAGKGSAMTPGFGLRSQRGRSPRRASSRPLRRCLPPTTL